MINAMFPKQTGDYIPKKGCTTQHCNQVDGRSSSVIASIPFTATIFCKEVSTRGCPWHFLFNAFSPDLLWRGNGHSSIPLSCCVAIICHRSGRGPTCPEALPPNHLAGGSPHGRKSR